MDAWHQDARATIYHGDCLEVLRALPDASVDAVVTDPPYGLEFMGKEWDSFAPERTKYHGERADTSKNIKDDKSKPSSRHGVSYSMQRPTFRRCQTCGKREFSGSPCVCSDPIWSYEQPAGTPTRMAAFQKWAELWAVECLRVLKPGGHLLAFGGTRTWHRLACAIEDAGFEVRDSIAWMYGSGFPKSLDVSKAIDKVNGEANRLHKFTEWMRSTGLPRKSAAAVVRPFAKNDATAAAMAQHYYSDKQQPAIPTPEIWKVLRPLCGDVPAWVDELVDRMAAEREVIGTAQSTRLAVAPGQWYDRPAVELAVTAPATDAAREWSGWGTALKPAHEPIVVARKPLVGTVAANVLQHGTGALNIDACRIAGEVPSVPQPRFSRDLVAGFGASEGRNGDMSAAPAGRWPANVVLDEDQAAELDQQSGNVASGGGAKGKMGGVFGNGKDNPRRAQSLYHDSGGASRFFYVAKAPARERPKVDGTAHPTVKPLTLMRWLCRLVTPPGGVILEPFAGSGTTIEAALLEGFRVVAIEREADYLPLIQARLDRVAAEEPEDEQLTLDASA
jgi:DNA modification methylase